MNVEGLRWARGGLPAPRCPPIQPLQTPATSTQPAPPHRPSATPPCTTNTILTPPTHPDPHPRVHPLSTPPPNAPRPRQPIPPPAHISTPARHCNNVLAPPRVCRPHCQLRRNNPDAVRVRVLRAEIPRTSSERAIEPTGGEARATPTSSASRTNGQSRCTKQPGREGPGVIQPRRRHLCEGCSSAQHDGSSGSLHHDPRHPRASRPHPGPGPRRPNVTTTGPRPPRGGLLPHLRAAVGQVSPASAPPLARHSADRAVDLGGDSRRGPPPESQRRRSADALAEAKHMPDELCGLSRQQGFV